MVITQHRPAVLSTLAGLAVERALDLIPRLLPICGIAQSIAAARAVEAARGEASGEAQEQVRERLLWGEQARSAGWRLAVDWPDLLGRPRPLAWLKQVRRSGASEADLAALLSAALPDLEPVATPQEFSAWARTADCEAAATARSALDIGEGTTPASPAGDLLNGAALAETARRALAAEVFEPLAPIGRPVEVGPLAMARDPLVEDLRAEFGLSATARIMALVVDMRVIVQGLRAGPGPTAAPDAWAEGPGAGTGRAVTARGPVFHRVDLAGDGTVARWRAVAPTDWHFAPRGPVAGALAQTMSPAAAKLLVTGFDPCAPWELAQAGGG